jgi:hypothetical protein
MDTDKIIQDLNRRFAVFLPEFYQRRIIFWYDEDKEFEDKLDEVVGSLTVGYQKKVPAGRIKPAFFVSNFWFLSIVFYCNVL